MVQVSYPGVYVQEVPSGVRTIVGVSTAVGMFIGRAKKGPLNQPTLCLSYSDFERSFSSDASVSDLARYMKLFFLNGGSQAYVTRIASGAGLASVILKNEAADAPGVLKLTAKQAGLSGETIRVMVNYNTPQPEATFNMEVFRVEVVGGRSQVVDGEVWKNLSMNPTSQSFAPVFLTQNSKLVDASLPAAQVAVNGFSRSGRAVPYNSGVANSLRAAWVALVGTTAPANRFDLSVDGSAFITVDLGAINTGALAPASFAVDFGTAIKNAIQGTFTSAGFAGVTVDVKFEDGPVPANLGAMDKTSVLKISSLNNGDIFIRPAASNDLAGPLMLGSAQGGLEVSAYAGFRPAPNGLTLQTGTPAILDGFGALLQSDINQITLPGFDAAGAPVLAKVKVDLQTSNAADSWFKNKPDTAKVNGDSDGLREKLDRMRVAINKFQQDNPRTFFWKAEVWGTRLAILPTGGEDNSIGTLTADPKPFPANSVLANVRFFSVGAGGTGKFQIPAGAAASDGSAPGLSEYDAAYEVIDKEVDLFNLMVLPPDAAPAVDMKDVYGPASVFCQRRRAFLLMDAPSSWTDVQKATSGIDGLRVGLVKDFSALFYPRLTINENGRKVNIGASGAVAGLMGRIDGTRGVWKAPAGTEADIRGVVGLDYRFSDGENGVLNPRAINTLRIFPNGIVNWGARTMDGDDSFGSEYKYIPIRRLALFMEESLYRGLKWVVFEPNDEPLWAQIRLNVGAFMHDLFRKGAFQGQKPADAYFVKCDAETTTQNDRNLGIVNIWVGFAPLKPAEFVVLYLQQMAGQIEV